MSADLKPLRYKNEAELKKRTSLKNCISAHINPAP